MTSFGTMIMWHYVAATESFAFEVRDLSLAETLEHGRIWEQPPSLQEQQENGELMLKRKSSSAVKLLKLS